MIIVYFLSLSYKNSILNSIAYFTHICKDFAIIFAKHNLFGSNLTIDLVFMNAAILCSLFNGVHTGKSL